MGIAGAVVFKSSKGYNGMKRPGKKTTEKTAYTIERNKPKNIGKEKETEKIQLKELTRQNRTIQNNERKFYQQLMKKV